MNVATGSSFSASSTAVDIQSGPIKNLIDAKIYLDEIKIVSDVYSKYVGYFVTWYTWFFWINVVVLGVVSNYFLQTNHSKFTPIIIPISVFFGICILIGMSATHYMNKYRNACINRITMIGECLNKDHSHLIQADVLIGDNVTKPVFKLIFISLCLTLVGWVIAAMWLERAIPYFR